MYAIKEAMVAKEHDPEADITVYYMDIRTQGKDFDAAQKRAEAKGIKFVRAKVADVMPWGNHLRLTYSTLDGVHSFSPYDMVVLSVGLESPPDAAKLAEIGGFKLNKYNFCATDSFDPLATSKDGVFVAGAFNGPMDIPESVTQSSGAAGIASGLMKKQRGKGIIHKSYPDEKDIGDEVRIGVFVCHCGINIGSVVDVPGVSNYASDMDGVVYYTESLYSCSQDAQEVLKDKIKEHNLNRVVIAACSPRTHEPLFQETLKDAGLNRSLFEMVNIRDQCSWVHANEPEAATKKSKDLVRMAVAKARHIQPLPEQSVPVNKVGLVVGGGIAGMTAALNMADQGFRCCLVEKEATLGGNSKKLAHTRKLVDQVKKNKLVTVYPNGELKQTSGFVGNFSSVISSGKGARAKEVTVDHGVIIIATGAREHRPDKVLGNPIKYSKKIVTQSELAEQLEGKGKKRAPESVVMVQCAGSRGDDLNYCSKTCCTTAVENALKVKEINSDAQVIMLYRDIRTYGYAEDLYQEAREKGVLFIPYETDNLPTISEKGRKLTVSYFDPILQDDVSMNPQMVALSVGMVPEETDTMSKLLKVPVTADSFFLEAHVKLRPVELPVDGVYVCGLAHAPKPVNEIIAQSQAASAKAAMPLIKGYVTVDPIVSNVDKSICIGCRLCTSLCPYQAIQMVKDENNRPKAETIVASCKACGICASHCPTFAISMGGFTNEQLNSQIEAFGREITATVEETA
jgi:heterodisulfide reductase subunit A